VIYNKMGQPQSSRYSNVSTDPLENWSRILREPRSTLWEQMV